MTTSSAAGDLSPDEPTAAAGTSPEHDPTRSWQPVRAHDIPRAAWTRSRTGTPRRAGRAVHTGLAAVCWPGYATALLLVRAGWHQRDAGRVIALLRQRTTPRWWWVPLPAVGIQLLTRVLPDPLASALLVVLVVGLVLAVVVGLCVVLRRAELRSRAERAGYVRPGGWPETDWVLLRAEADDGDPRRAVRDLPELLDAVVPEGSTVGAAPLSDVAEDARRQVGFEPTSTRGHVVLTVSR